MCKGSACERYGTLEVTLFKEVSLLKHAARKLSHKRIFRPNIVAELITAYDARQYQ